MMADFMSPIGKSLRTVLQEHISKGRTRLSQISSCLANPFGEYYQVLVQITVAQIYSICGDNRYHRFTPDLILLTLKSSSEE